jgi:hypothetical protein
MNSLFKSRGKLLYSIEPKVGPKLIVQVDLGICLFYRSLIPKWHPVRPQAFKPHISVVRNEVPPRMDLWGQYEGEMVEFYYDIDTQRDHQYWWLDCYSKRLDEIRAELGLTIPVPRRPLPEGFRKRYHTTLGNMKDLSTGS